MSTLPTISRNLRLGAQVSRRENAFACRLFAAIETSGLLCRRPGVSRAIAAREHARGYPQEIHLPTPQLGAIESSSLSVTCLGDAVDAGGTVTTVATLVRALNPDNDADEKRLRELLYNLRIDGIIKFDRPPGRFSASRRTQLPAPHERRAP